MCILTTVRRPHGVFSHDLGDYANHKYLLFYRFIEKNLRLSFEFVMQLMSLSKSRLISKSLNLLFFKPLTMRKNYDRVFTFAVLAKNHDWRPVIRHLVIASQQRCKKASAYQLLNNCHYNLEFHFPFHNGLNCLMQIKCRKCKLKESSRRAISWNDVRKADKEPQVPKKRLLSVVTWTQASVRLQQVNSCSLSNRTTMK